LIANWDINTSIHYSICINNTDAYFLIKNCKIIGNGTNDGSIVFMNVTNGKIEQVQSELCLISILIYESSNNMIKNCIMSNPNGIRNNTGIGILSSNQNIIDNNTIFNIHDQAIALRNADNNIVKNNYIHDNLGEGILLMNDTSGNIIENNTIIKCGQAGGIALWSDHQPLINNTIKYNHIENNQYGINLRNASNNFFEKNNLISNQFFGFSLANSSKNTFFKNSIENSTFGIILNSSINNNINNNNFIENKIKGFFIDSNNNWDGNYWDRSRILPKLIFGISDNSFPFKILVDIDRHPAQEPYDI